MLSEVMILSESAKVGLGPGSGGAGIEFIPGRLLISLVCALHKLQFVLSPMAIDFAGLGL